MPVSTGTNTAFLFRMTNTPCSSSFAFVADICGDAA
jgi:hypothetical protein